MNKFFWIREYGLGAVHQELEQTAVHREAKVFSVDIPISEPDPTR